MIQLDQKAIGKQIKDLRIAKKMTQKALAEALHVTPQAVSNWERGLNTPDLDMLVSLSALFGQKVGVLLLQEAKEKDVITRLAWPMRFLLLPFLMFLPLYGILRAFLFLIVPWGSMIFAAFGVVILSGLTQWIVMKNRVVFYLILTLGLFLSMIVVTRAFEPFMTLDSVPRYTEVQSQSTEAYWENIQVLSARIQEEYYELGALMYVPGTSKVVLYDFSESFDQIETTIQFVSDVKSVVSVGHDFYVFTEGTLGNLTDLYRINLEAHSADKVLSLPSELRGFVMMDLLYCYVVDFDTFTSTIFLLEDDNLHEVRSVDVSIYDMVAEEWNGYASIQVSSGSYQVVSWNYVEQDPDGFQLFPFSLISNIHGAYDLAKVDNQIFASFSSQIWRIGFGFPELLDWVGSVDDLTPWDNQGYVFCGNLITYDFEDISGSMYVDEQFHRVSGQYFFNANGLFRYVFENGTITQIKVFSSNVEGPIPSPFWRTFVLFLSIPFFTLPLSFEIGIKERRNEESKHE